MPLTGNRIPPPQEHISPYSHDNREDEAPQNIRTSLSATISDEENIATRDTENGLTLMPSRSQEGKAAPESTAVLPAWQTELLQQLKSQQAGETRLYTLNGEKAFYDQSNRILMASAQASQNDRMILAAILIARENTQGSIEVTGSPHFIEKTLGLIAAHNVNVHLKNPEQQQRLDAIEKARAQNRTSVESSSPTPASTSDTSTITSSPAPTQERAQTTLHNPQLSAIERETLRVGITGKLTAAASAPYRHNPDHPESFFVTLRTKQGEHTYWGADLKQALQDAGHQPGDMVKLQYLVASKGNTASLPWQTTLDATRTTATNAWQVSSAVDSRLLVNHRPTATFSAPAPSPGTAPVALQTPQERMPNKRALKTEPQPALLQQESTKPTLKPHP